MITRGCGYPGCGVVVCELSDVEALAAILEHAQADHPIAYQFVHTLTHTLSPDALAGLGVNAQLVATLLDESRATVH